MISRLRCDCAIRRGGRYRRFEEDRPRLGMRTPEIYVDTIAMGLLRSAGGDQPGDLPLAWRFWRARRSMKSSMHNTTSSKR